MFCTQRPHSTFNESFQLPLVDVTRIAYIFCKNYVFRAGNCKDDGNITSCNDHYAVTKVMVYEKTEYHFKVFTTYKKQSKQILTIYNVPTAVSWVTWTVWLFFPAIVFSCCAYIWLWWELILVYQNVIVYQFNIY